jgi:hypothetical protein
MKGCQQDSAATARPLPRQSRVREFHLCDNATPCGRKPTVENIVPSVFTPVLAKNVLLITLLGILGAFRGLQVKQI